MARIDARLCEEMLGINRQNEAGPLSIVSLLCSPVAVCCSCQLGVGALIEQQLHHAMQRYVASMHQRRTPPHVVGPILHVESSCFPRGLDQQLSRLLVRGFQCQHQRSLAVLLRQSWLGVESQQLLHQVCQSRGTGMHESRHAPASQPGSLSIEHPNLLGAFQQLLCGGAVLVLQS